MEAGITDHVCDLVEFSIQQTSFASWQQVQSVLSRNKMLQVVRVRNIVFPPDDDINWDEISLPNLKRLSNVLT